jgi:hypothetical protein
VTPDDDKLVILARSALARIGAAQGAAVRDVTGRAYAAATVDLPTLKMTALELAVAQAVSAGAGGLEAAVVVGGDTPGIGCVRDLGHGVPVWHCDSGGRVVGEQRS